MATKHIAGTIIKHPDTSAIHPDLVNSILAALPNVKVLDVKPDVFTDQTPKMFISDIEAENQIVLMPDFVSGIHAEHQMSVITKTAFTLKFDHPDDDRTPWVNTFHLLLSDLELRGNKPTLRDNDQFIPGAELHYAAYLATLIASSGVDAVTLLDPHDHVSVDYLTQKGISVTTLTAIPKQVEYLKQNNLLPSADTGGIVIADNGSIGRALYLSKITGLPILARIIKKRKNGYVFIEKILGEQALKGKDILLPDDILATGGTLIKDSSAIKTLGANSVTGLVTHTKGVSTAPDKMRSGLKDELLNNLLVTNSTPYTKELERIPGIHSVDIMEILIAATRAVLYPTPENKQVLETYKYTPMPKAETLRQLRQKFPNLVENN